MSATWISGKVVLITGAASGIGAAVAERLHRAGALLVLTDIDAAGVEGVARSLGNDVLAFEADVRALPSLNRVVEQVLQRHGRLDVVWANAGVASFGTVAQTDPAAWALNVQVNLVGVFNTLHAALPAVLRQRGHVAVTASLASFVNVPGMSAYCATKAGVEALCNSLRIEVAHHGVTVGSIHPAWVATPLVAHGEGFAAFRRLRAALPAMVNRDMPVADAAQHIAEGIAGRRDRVYLPGWVRFMRWLRTPLHTRGGERDLRRAMPEIERSYAEDLARHGRAAASFPRALRE